MFVGDRLKRGLVPLLAHLGGGQQVLPRVVAFPQHLSPPPVHGSSHSAPSSASHALPGSLATVHPDRCRGSCGHGARAFKSDFRQHHIAHARTLRTHASAGGRGAGGTADRSLAHLFHQRCKLRKVHCHSFSLGRRRHRRDAAIISHPPRIRVRAGAGAAVPAPPPPTHPRWAPMHHPPPPFLGGASTARGLHGSPSLPG